MITISRKPVILIALIAMTVPFSGFSNQETVSNEEVYKLDLLVTQFECNFAGVDLSTRNERQLKVTTETVGAEGAFWQGDFVSQTISMQKCQNEMEFLNQWQAEPVPAKGVVHRYETKSVEEIWGRCREHHSVGGHWYDCFKGHREVVRCDAEVEIVFKDVVLSRSIENVSCTLSSPKTQPCSEYGAPFKCEE